MLPYPLGVGLPDWLQVISGTVGGVGLAVLVVLLVKGVLVTAASCDERVASLRASHEVEVELIRAAHADSVTALSLACDNTRRRLEQQLEREQVESDAWRTAHTDEAAARRAAELATRQLLESSNVTMALLSALKDSLARTPPPEHEGSE